MGWRTKEDGDGRVWSAAGLGEGKKMVMGTVSVLTWRFDHVYFIKRWVGCGFR